jgi:sporulation integral membrane protein YlbJ
MKNPALGFFLALSHYLSAITMGLIMRFYGKEKTVKNRRYTSNPIADMLEHRKKDGRPFGTLMKDAVTNGIDLILMIGGFIIFFSVITRMLKISGFLSWLSIILSRAIPLEAVTPDIISGLLIGFLEVTNGANACAALQVPLLYKILMLSFMIGFGGLSVNAQVMGIISGTDLKFGIYFILKLLQGLAASAYSYILVVWLSDLQVFNIYSPAGTAVWNTFTGYSPMQVFMSSAVNLLLLLVFMSAMSIMKCKKRLYSSKSLK